MTRTRHPASWIHPLAVAVAMAMAIMSTLAASSSAMAALPLLETRDGKPSLAPLLERVTPAVVNIAVESQGSDADNPLLRDPFFRRFFNLPEGFKPEPRRSAGSGVIVDAQRGYVLTNHHVIENATEIAVTLKDRRRFDAKLIGSDPGTDVALLQIKADNLRELPMGDSASLAVGDFVVAIGNPFGLGQTVTSGIVSALGRSGLNIEGYEDFIQTDASINPGNSGGALVDLDGNLVGINTAILAPAGGNIGIGFAVPVNMARAVMEQLVEYGEVRRGRLGVVIQDVTPDLAEALGIDTSMGAVVSQVEADSPAEDAGFEAGDVVVEFDGHEVRNAADLRNRVGLMPVGKTVKVVVLRDGKRKTLRPKIGKAQVTRLDGSEATQGLAGALFADIPRDHPNHGKVEGALVTGVEPGSPAARNGLRAGDIIVGVNRQPVHNAQELRAALESAGKVFALNVLRDDTRLFLVIR